MSYKQYSIITLIFIFFVSQGWAFTTGTGISSEELRHVLDSLELRIQEKRRSGEAIDALIREVETVKLAIENENVRLQKSGTVKVKIEPEQKTDEKKPIAKEIKLPTSIIDWLIIIVGAIAVVAFSLLVILQLIQKIKKRNKTKIAKVKPVKYSTVSKENQEESAPLPAQLSDKVENSTAAPEWVKAMRSYGSDGVRPKIVPPAGDLEEAAKAPVSEGAPKNSPSLEELVEQTFAENGIGDVQQHVVHPKEPSFSRFEDEDPSVLPVQDNISQIKHLVEETGVEEHLDQIEQLINEPVQEASPVEENAVSEPPKTRAQQVKEIILEKFEAGIAPVEIAKSVGMSVGEVELILTLARRL